MHSLLLYLLTLPPVLADCTRFTTSDHWAAKLSSWPSYRFLADGPIRQVSNYTVCTEEFAANATPERACSGNPAYCKVLAEGGISASARFSVTPTNNSAEALEAFFDLVSKAVEANGRGDDPIDTEPPQYQICGNIKHEFEKVGNPFPGYCITPGNSGWALYDPQYICVNGTAEECTNGPFESGTELVVCGVGKLTNGYLNDIDNRTFSWNGESYTAKDVNPSVNSGLVCQRSMGVVDFEFNAWSFGIVGLAMVLVFLL